MDCYYCQDMKLFYKNVKNTMHVNKLKMKFQNSFFSELPLALLFNGEIAYLHTGLITEQEWKCWRQESRFEHKCCQSGFWWRRDLGDCFLVTVFRSLSSVFHHSVKFEWL